jgi:ABC-type multidrug transport system fused ATPase/permease subunit
VNKMKLTSNWKKAWELLALQERRNAIKVLGIMIIGAFASAAMVGSVFPFLAVLAEPSLVERNPVLAWAYRIGGFSSDYWFLVALGITAIAVIVISNVVLILQTWAVLRFTQMRVHSISRRLLARYLAQPYEFFLGRHSGDMSTNILAEAQQSVSQFLRPMADVISASLTIAAVVATMIIADPIVATVGIGLFVLTYIVLATFTRRYARAMGIARTSANASRFRLAAEALGGIKDVKLLGREADYLDRFTVPSLTVARSEVGVMILGQTPRFGIQMIAFGGIVVLCLVLLDPEGLRQREALGGMLPLIGLLAFAGQRLMPELQKLYQSVVQMTAGAAAINRVYNDLHGGQETKLYRPLPEPLGLKSALELRGVSYAYPGAECAGLSDVNLTVRAGERIGIVGPSGAGKTTLADVVLCLLRPQVGTIRTDGVDITQNNLRAWQQSVGYVPQDIFLTDASLAENIALGLRSEEIDQAKVEHAASVAQLHDFVMTDLRDGYRTIIGERGVRLSGGQRQRIGIARALYHDADLIVFDEATSALDNITEREVMASIDALPGSKTVMIIAHRLSTVRKCDRIILLVGGKIAAEGSWENLIRESAEFRALTASSEAA